MTLEQMTHEDLLAYAEVIEDVLLRTRMMMGLPVPEQPLTPQQIKRDFNIAWRAATNQGPSKTMIIAAQMLAANTQSIRDQDDDPGLEVYAVLGALMRSLKYNKLLPAWSKELDEIAKIVFVETMTYVAELADQIDEEAQKKKASENQDV